MWFFFMKKFVGCVKAGQVFDVGSEVCDLWEESTLMFLKRVKQKA